MGSNFFVDAFTTLKMSWRNLVRTPVTIETPYNLKERVERYRASFALTHDEHGEEACIGCKICENICPSSIITVTTGPKRESPATGKKRGYCDDFTLNLNACIYCELCVQVCPTDAIVMVKSPEQPAFFREDLVLTRDKLYANETLKSASWANASKLKETQDPNRKPPVVEEPGTPPAPVDGKKEGA